MSRSIHLLLLLLALQPTASQPDTVTNVPLGAPTAQLTIRVATSSVPTPTPGATQYRAAVSLYHPASAWLGIGIGQFMIGSKAVVGLSPTSNPTRPAVGIYNLVSQTSPSQQKLVTGTLASHGITSSSFTQSPTGGTWLNFSILQNSDQFNFFPSPSPTNPTGQTNLILAVGSSNVFDHHLDETRTKLSFYPPPTGSPTQPPTSTSPTTKPTLGAGTTTPTTRAPSRAPSHSPVRVPTTPRPTTRAPSQPPKFNFTFVQLDQGYPLIFSWYPIDSPDGERVLFTLTSDRDAWLGVGVGQSMIGSLALIGTDPATNPTWPTGLYRLLGQVDPPTQVVRENDLASRGIANVSFTRTPGSSELKFSVPSKSLPKTTDFVVWPAADMVFALGLDSVFQKHDQKVALRSTFDAAATPPVVATTAPTVPIVVSTAPTASSDQQQQQNVSSNTSTLRYTIPLNFVSDTLDLTSTTSSSDTDVATLTLKHTPLAQSGTSSLTNSWLGLGVGSQMVGSYAVVGVDPTLNPTRPGVALCALTGQTGPADIKVVTTDLASVGITDASFVTDSTDGSSTLTFTVRKSLAAQNLAFAATPGGPTAMVFALGASGVFQQHIGNRVASVVLQNAVGVAPAPTSTDLSASTPAYALDTAIQAHIVLAFLAYLVFFPTGASVALMRAAGSKRWFPFHKWIQIGSWSTASGSFVCAVVAVANRGQAHFSDPHMALGLALYIAATLQILNGLARPHVNPKSAAFSDQTPQRKVWMPVHRLIAAFTLVAGVAQAMLGADQELPKYISFAGRIQFSGTPASNIGVLQGFIYGVGSFALVVLVVGGGVAVVKRVGQGRRQQQQQQQPQTADGAQGPIPNGVAGGGHGGESSPVDHKPTPATPTVTKGNDGDVDGNRSGNAAEVENGGGGASFREVAVV